MPVLVRFTSSSMANGLTVRAFLRSQVGVGLFFHDVGTGVVAGDHVVFQSLTPPNDYAFTLESPTGTRFRSGRVVLGSPTSTKTDTFLVMSAGTITFTPAQLAGLLPAVPVIAGSLTITSLALTVGTGMLTADGTGFQSTFFGPVAISFTYSFTLDPVIEPANMGFPGSIAPSIEVRTLGMNLSAVQGGPVGGFVNFVMNALYDLFSGSFASAMQNKVQGAIDNAVATALAAKGAPVGTIATIETLTIDPTAGATLTAFAGLSVEKLCPASPTGGSVNIRPPEQLAHLRAIRDGLLMDTPQGRGYVALFEAFTPELIGLLVDDPALLKLVDRIVLGVLRAFPVADPGRGTLSPELAHEIDEAMRTIEAAASRRLAINVSALRPEVRSFVGRPAREVLAESRKMIGCG